MVNWIWFIMIAMGLIDFLISGNFKGINETLSSSAQNSIELLIGLTGIMAIWSGIMKICERSGIVILMGKLLAPIMEKIFPGLERKNPRAMGNIVMNIATNMMGLSNAATPFGIKAMEELQLINPDKTLASDYMVTFLILNAACIQLLPTTVISIMTGMGSLDPMGIILPGIISTSSALITGLILCKLLQRYF